ncbi:hypothetical protein N7G274_003665 [Stereocaulon virgatum]|uniref:Uncharacterized protein n=1 Tax=Stereocaulon virgatum TaxID=373712 RepID=A0ABR4ACZ0_9LECA
MPDNDNQTSAAAECYSAEKSIPTRMQTPAGIQNYVDNVDKYNAHLWSQQQSGLTREQSRRQYLKAWMDEFNERSRWP